MLANVTLGALQWLLRIPIYYFLTFATRLRNHLQREYDILYDVVADTNDSSIIHRKYNDNNCWKLNDLIPIILWTLDCLAPLESELKETIQEDKLTAVDRVYNIELVKNTQTNVGIGQNTF